MSGHVDWRQPQRHRYRNDLGGNELGKDYKSAERFLQRVLVLCLLLLASFHALMILLSERVASRSYQLEHEVSCHVATMKHHESLFSRLLMVDVHYCCFLHRRRSNRTVATNTHTTHRCSSTAPATRHLRWTHSFRIRTSTSRRRRVIGFDFSALVHVLLHVTVQLRRCGCVLCCIRHRWSELHSMEFGLSEYTL